MGKTFACAICAKKGYTCCRLSKDQAGFSFPLSAKEKKSISEFLQGKSMRFFTKAPNSERLISLLQSLFLNDSERIYTLFPENRHYEHLLTNKKGYCVFLEQSGCILPRKIRPFYCRIFPFWISGNRVTFFHFDFCQAQKGVRSVRKLMLNLDTNYSRIMLLYVSLRKTWEIDE